VVTPGKNHYHHVYDLIYPDRYDLLSRTKFARWLIERREMWEADEMALLALARGTTPWGEECDMLTYMWQAWCGKSEYPGPHYEAFHADVRKFYNAFANLLEFGWIPEKQQVQKATGEIVMVKGSKLQVIRGRKLASGIDGRKPDRYARRWFMADAQHRLTIWFGIFNQDRFYPEQVEILDYRVYAPFVTTPAYLETGRLASMTAFKEELDEFVDKIENPGLAI
jgi:hypothetical protein